MVNTETIQTKRLEDVEECPPIDFMKIDVQGGALVVTAKRKSPIWDSQRRAHLRVWRMRTGVSFIVGSSDRLRLEGVV